MDDNRFPERRSPIHLPLFNKGAEVPIVFVTQCVKGKKAILASSEVHDLLVQEWLKLDAWLVGRYVIMPDHIHLFCSPNSSKFGLTDWMRAWKSCVAKRWPQPNQGPIWQKSFWDRQLRSGESYANKWKYVLDNPSRAGIAIADEWPYKGELTILSWHD